MAYLVNLDQFYGPLDLLLYLIEKDEMDIYDISVASITDQYMKYIQSTGDIDLDRMGDFLVMASYLLNLKSKMLLPRQAAKEDDEEQLDPREELLQRLLEYKRYKQAAEVLAEKLDEEGSRVFFRDGLTEYEQVEEIESDIKHLIQAYKRLKLRSLPRENYLLPTGNVNVSEKMDEIIHRLEGSRGGLIFQDFFKEVLSWREAVALFLALLELVRLQKVKAIQLSKFGEIELFIQVAEDNADA